MTALAIYDIDRTITRRATYTPFLIFAARRLEPWRLVFLPLVFVITLAHLLGLVNRARLKEINLHLLLGHSLHPEKLAAIGEAFAEKTVEQNVYPQAFATIEADRAAGRRLVLATASFSFYVVPLARRLGFDDAIATGSVRGIEGLVHARIEGENCYASGKLRMIGIWMEDQKLERGGFSARFYSDSASDLPMFEWVDEPIAVNPSPRLRRIADKRGWPIIAWG